MCGYVAPAAFFRIRVARVKKLLSIQTVDIVLSHIVHSVQNEGANKGFAFSDCTFLFLNYFKRGRPALGDAGQRDFL